MYNSRLLFKCFLWVIEVYYWGVEIVWKKAILHAPLVFIFIHFNIIFHLSRAKPFNNFNFNSSARSDVLILWQVLLSFPHPWTVWVMPIQMRHPDARPVCAVSGRTGRAMRLCREFSTPAMLHCVCAHCASVSLAISVALVARFLELLEPIVVRSCRCRCGCSCSCLLVLAVSVAESENNFL